MQAAGQMAPSVHKPGPALQPPTFFSCPPLSLSQGCDPKIIGHQIPVMKGQIVAKHHCLYTLLVSNPGGYTLLYL